MQLLLRKISADSSGLQEYSDAEISRDEVLIGSSPSSDIQLLDSGIAPTHARLKQQGGTLLLRAAKGRQFLFNGEQVGQAKLKGGDEIQLGSQRFICTAVPGFDLSLEWHYVEMPGHLLANAYRSLLADLNFSPRKLAWTLAIGIVVLFGLLPAAEFFWQPADANLNEPRDMPLSSLWLSGPLHSAHQVALGDNCAGCHQDAFVQVKDETCQQCHSGVTQHLSAQHPDLASFGEFANFDKFACQNCHKEHNEPQTLVATADSLCRNCHQNMEPAIAGFASERHPEFALTLLKPQLQLLNGTLAVDWHPAKASSVELVQEINHLNYPHDVHLDVEAVRHPRRDDALQCADCHRLSSDREHFEPISMERDCAACHDLSFDERNPQKQLPHGAPQAVFDALEAHFVKLAFGEQQDSGFQRRRLPGREQQEENCRGNYDCARGQALREAERQFAQRGCITCHQVSELEGAEGVERWQVLPVKINNDWYSEAHFDHQSHLTQSEQSGDQLCLSCHQASNSSSSADVLMPGLQQCVDCHSDGSAGDRVAVNCIACHGYHRRESEQTLPHFNPHLTATATELLEGVANGEL